MIELSIIIPVLNEADNIGPLINKIRHALSKITKDFEILLIDGGSTDDTVKIAQEMGARVIIQDKPSFGNALIEGFRASRGKVFLTLDADFSHGPEFIPDMLGKIDEADVVIASRYVKGGGAKMPFLRYILSRALNSFFQYGLSLPIKDNTSGFRAYKKEVINSIVTHAKNFEVLPEILIEVYSKGWKIKEIPFCYMPRKSGSSHLKLFKFAIGYLKAFLRLWKKRNSIYFADYDERAYHSRIFLQRYWQRKRYNIIMSFIETDGLLVDLGCGSSKIIQDLPEAVAVDISIEKLRYIKKSNQYLINATLGSLPFKNEIFACIICSQVIEHTNEKFIFAEMKRILRPGGILILGTPDYGKLSWRVIDFLYGLLLPGGYKDKHIRKYTNSSLRNALLDHGFSVLSQRYVCGAELIIKARKIT
jgi:dolichol-phosphate mannosyltransferase